MNRPGGSFETLESRRLLAGISGIVWGDADRSRTFDETESPASGVTVFIDANNNGKLDSGERSDLTDADGAYLFSGLAAGTYDVSVVNPSGVGQTSPGRFGSLEHHFDIGLNYISEVTPSQARAIEAAASRWEAIIVGDLPDVNTDIGLVDDVVIDVEIHNLDGEEGTLAQAEPTRFRANGGLPSRGLVEVDLSDIANLEAQGKLVETLTHEIAHVLGFGTIWTTRNLVSGASGSNPIFTGAKATAEYKALYHVNVSGVPLENGSGGGGTDLVHWRESSLDLEQMTGFSEDATQFEPISRITIGQFEDLGYQVNYAAADAFDPVMTFARGWTPINAGVRAFTRRVAVSTNEEQDDIDFGLRKNRAPVINAFTVAPSPVKKGDLLTLRASASDRDGDAIVGVTFYRESNGIAGLQSGSDTYISTKFTAKRGWFTAQTSTANVAAGESVFYAIAVDEFLFGGRRGTTVLVADQPVRPNPLIATRQSATSVLLQWKDRSVDESGFRIELATSADFVNDFVRRYNVPANSRSSLVIDLASEVTFFRIRSYNFVGNSAWTSTSVA